MSTDRTARALARAGRAPSSQYQQPQASQGAGSTRDNPPQPIVGMTNKMKYDNATHFTDMLTQIGVTRACINQLQIDDFDTMRSIVIHYKGDISNYETYLKTINKSMNNTTNPIRFSPIVMDRLLLVIHHFIQAVYSSHSIPDIEIIDWDRSMELIEPYRMYKEFGEN